MKEKIIAVAGLVFLVLFVLNISTIFYFYKQYNDNLGTINQQNSLTKIKLEGLEKDSENFKGSIDSLGASVKNYELSLSSMQDKMAASEKSVRDVSEVVTNFRANSQDLQKKYDAAVSQIAALKQKLESLSGSLDEIRKVTTGSVNLGKISVQNDKKESD